MNSYIVSSNHNAIHENDVICGRGGATNNQNGNKLFRQLVNNHKSNYLASSKVEKKCVAKFIIDTIRRRGGRFLKFNQTTRELIDIGDIAAVEKACQALREGLKVRINKRKMVQEDKPMSLPRIKTSSSTSNMQNPLAEHAYPKGAYQMPVNQLHYYTYPSDYSMRNPLKSYNIYGQPGYGQRDYVHPQGVSCDNQSLKFNQEHDYNISQYVGRCTCKKSNCLKLYCQCFANLVYCSSEDCRCANCYNAMHYNEIVHQAKINYSNSKVITSKTV